VAERLACADDLAVRLAGDIICLGLYQVQDGDPESFSLDPLVS
jgi:hypothetical protein